jgi:hypothetical protein
VLVVASCSRVSTVMVEAEKPTNLIWRSHEVEQRTMRYRRGSILQSSQEAEYRKKVEITIT